MPLTKIRDEPFGAFFATSNQVMGFQILAINPRFISPRYLAVCLLGVPPEENFAKSPI